MTLALAGAAQALGAEETASELEKNFIQPPDSARPWVYWFWLNGNITREGITADLEAMKRVGHRRRADHGGGPGRAGGAGGVHGHRSGASCSSTSSPRRNGLGLEVNMNNDAGWNGSGGPWIKPEQSMQKVVWTRDQRRRPEALRRHAAAAARPITASTATSPCWRSRRRATTASTTSRPKRSSSAAVSPARRPRRSSRRKWSIARDRIVDLTAQMDKDGRLVWDVPAGNGRCCASATRPPARQCAPRRPAAAAWSATS